MPSAPRRFSRASKTAAVRGLSGERHAESDRGRRAHVAGVERRLPLLLREREDRGGAGLERARLGRVAEPALRGAQREARRRDSSSRVLSARGAARSFEQWRDARRRDVALGRRAADEPGSDQARARQGSPRSGGLRRDAWRAASGSASAATADGAPDGRRGTSASSPRAQSSVASGNEMLTLALSGCADSAVIPAPSAASIAASPPRRRSGTDRAVAWRGGASSPPRSAAGTTRSGRALADRRRRDVLLRREELGEPRSRRTGACR